MMLASTRGNFGIVDELIKNGADCTAAKLNGSTALVLAIQALSRSSNDFLAEHVNVIRLLIQHGADVHHVNAEGKSCLHMACGAESTSLISLLISNGANVSIKDKNGKTALDLVSAADRLEILVEVEMSVTLLENHDHALWFVLVQEDGEANDELYAKLTGTVVALVSSHPSLAAAKDLHGHVAMVIHTF